MRVEVHGAGTQAKRATAAEVIGLLLEAGYDVEHAESGRVVRPGDAALAAEGHLHARPAHVAP